jgi:hypothetical protein
MGNKRRKEKEYQEINKMLQADSSPSYYTSYDD